jgi:hypothetical protein
VGVHGDRSNDDFMSLDYVVVADRVGFFLKRSPLVARVASATCSVARSVAVNSGCSVWGGLGR